ncbi:MAG TPA: site-specific DNA-methyltransferase [Phycisphaerae bacterium]
MFCGDNLELMRSLPDGFCDLIYADPPFATGQVRRTKQSDHVFDDRWPGRLGAFLEFLTPRLVDMHRLISPRGSLYVHLDWRTVHYVKCRLDAIFGPENFLNEIIWSYRTGGRSSRWFARKHDSLLVYAKRAGAHTFNLLRHGTFRTDGLNHDQNGRPYKNTRKGRLYFHADGPAMTDVWELPFLSTVSLERNGYPSQKPEALLERIVRASSNPGDVVGDFFCGSGTTLAVAQRLGRRWMGCDISAKAIQLAESRLSIFFSQTS